MCSSDLFSLSLPSRPPYFPFLSLLVLPILPSRSPYFPFLSLPVLPIFPFSPFSSSPLSSSLLSLSLPFRPPYFPFRSLSVIPNFPFSPFSSSLFSLSLPSRPPYYSGTLRGDPNPVVMKEFVKILFSIYRTVVLSAYFFYFILLYHV